MKRSREERFTGVVDGLPRHLTLRNVDLMAASALRTVSPLVHGRLQSVLCYFRHHGIVLISSPLVFVLERFVRQLKDDKKARLKITFKQ